MSDLFSGVSAELFSGIAVVLSGYSLWQTSLKEARLKVFIPPLIRYASPYQNSIFEIFEIPITVINEGAQSGTILSFDLRVTNPDDNASKYFYSAGVGPWSVAKAHGEALEPFTPISLTGRASQSATILFFARGDSSVPQIVGREGRYLFLLNCLTAKRGGVSIFKGEKAKPMTFEMNLPVLDHRAFTGGAGTLPLHHPQWQPSVSSR